MPPVSRERASHLILPLTLGRGITPGYEEAANKIRILISRLTLHPLVEGSKLELQGRLALLMGAPNVYPNMRIASSGGLVVAEERYRLSPRHPVLRYRLRAYA